MKSYSGWEWLLIDAANNFGKDKLTFEERIQWAYNNMSNLERLSDQAETKPLYIKAVMAIRKAQQGIPTGHMVGVDAICSGIQVMSVLTGCEAGARATGLIEPDVRSDAYSEATKVMERLLGTSVGISRAAAKQALMTSFYGSKEQPKLIFGEDTPELNAFYQAAMEIAPGAWELLQDLLNSWDSNALAHEWVMPDGYKAKVKVMVPVTTRVEVDELNSSFTYQYKVNAPVKKGLSNAANVVHSVDAYILRCMHRRCNYDPEVIKTALEIVELELTARQIKPDLEPGTANPKAVYYMVHYDRSGIADVVIAPYLDGNSASIMDTKHLEGLQSIMRNMLLYPPFEVVTVHDEYKCHPNNVNVMRAHYRDVLCQLADSELLSDLFTQLLKTKVKYKKLSTDLSKKIVGNYALC